MKYIITLAALMLAAPAFADSDMAGDAAAGEKDFKRCKSCHAITDDAGEDIVKGGKTGPNLFNVIGRTAGSAEGFKYSKSLEEAGEKGLVWDTETLAEFIKDPKDFLKEHNDDKKARSKMTFKMKKGGEDIAAYLKTVSPDAPEDDADEKSDDS